MKRYNHIAEVSQASCLVSSWCIQSAPKISPVFINDFSDN